MLKRLLTIIEGDERLLDAYLAVCDHGSDLLSRVGDAVASPFHKGAQKATSEYFRLDGLGRARAKQ